MKTLKGKISIFFYVLAIFLLLLYGVAETLPNFSMTEMGRLMLLCGSCVFFYFGGFFLSKQLGNNKPMKINLWIFFVLYLGLLITLTLFDSMWGRHGISNWSFDNILKGSNFIPFKTIRMYIGQFDSLYSTRQVLLNLFGNIIALMPMAFFLPLLFEKQKKFKIFFLTVFLVVLGIEVTQQLTFTGYFDVDDFILNIFGACILYFILKIKSVKNVIDNIFLLEHHEIEKKSIIRIILCCIMICFIGVGIVKYRNKLYNGHINDLQDRYNPSIQLLMEDSECTNEKSLFYEDDLYQYYLMCYKSDEFYALVNGEDKYLLNDLLMDKEKYDVGINKILWELEHEEIEYSMENKYHFIPIESDYNVSFYIQDEDILTAKFGRNMKELNLIPLEIGETVLEITFQDMDYEIAFSKIYNIQIDENLKVTYEEKTSGI